MALHSRYWFDWAGETAMLLQRCDVSSDRRMFEKSTAIEHIVWYRTVMQRRNHLCRISSTVWVLATLNAVVVVCHFWCSASIDMIGWERRYFVRVGIQRTTLMNLYAMNSRQLTSKSEMAHCRMCNRDLAGASVSLTFEHSLWAVQSFQN